MLQALIRYSLRYSSLVVLAAVLVVAFAGYRLPHTSVDVFPELNAPTAPNSPPWFSPISSA